MFQSRLYSIAGSSTPNILVIDGGSRKKCISPTFFRMHICIFLCCKRILFPKLDLAKVDLRKILSMICNKQTQTCTWKMVIPSKRKFLTLVWFEKRLIIFLPPTKKFSIRYCLRWGIRLLHCNNLLPTHVLRALHGVTKCPDFFME